MDQNLYEKCVIYIQVYSGVDIRFYPELHCWTWYSSGGGAAKEVITSSLVLVGGSSRTAGFPKCQDSFHGATVP